MSRHINFDSYYDPPEPQWYPCAMCGCHEDECICPVCPVCECQGDPVCYDEKAGQAYHGLRQSQAQLFSLVLHEMNWAEQARAEGEGEYFEYATMRVGAALGNWSSIRSAVELECLMSIVDAMPEEIWDLNSYISDHI